MKTYCDYNCSECHFESCPVYKGEQSLQEKISEDNEIKRLKEEEIKNFITKKGIIAAILKDGNAIEFANENDKDNASLIALALLKSPSSYIYTSKRLKNDPILAMIAVYFNVFNYIFLNDSLKKNKDIAIVAMLKKPGIYNSLDPLLQTDPDILKIKNELDNKRNL